MLSSFTLISLIGVLLGVLVLVVVMAVYAGLERQVKGRILGFTPHILASHFTSGGSPGQPMRDWREAAEVVRKLPRVQAATAFVSDNVIVDVDSWQKPVMFRGVDTSDSAQVEGIADMLDKTAYPGSTADLGLDDRAVISSVLAEQLTLRVGDTMRLYSTRNFEEVMRAYKATERPVLREAYPAEWDHAVRAIRDGWQQGALSFEAIQPAYEALDRLRSEPLRDPEMRMLEELLVALESGEKVELAKIYRFTEPQQQQILAAIRALEQTDGEKLDADTLKGLRAIVLPKEVTVCGVYSASQMAVTPDLFVPLPLAQDLAGLDEAVQGIALRLDDAYAAEQVAAASRQKLGDGWSFVTWGDQYQAFFALISQQRVMMYFALSFIVLVSAFSMMAVMFTVTIQKRREIGVMKALGAAPGQIVRVFLYQGMLLGLLGAMLGIGLGRLVIHYRGALQEFLRTLGFDPFSASFTGFGVLPAHNDPMEQVVIGVMAFLLCSVAALVPAFFAARCDAAKSLRNL
jgi:lipoprotein-releasing system permease protein